MFAVVIPALDEAEVISAAIESARSGSQACPETAKTPGPTPDPEQAPISASIWASISASISASIWASGGQAGEPESGSGPTAAPAADPALNLPVEIRAPSQMRAPSPPGCEIVVVDGGSRDATCERARAAGARVIQATPGRASQLQAGFEATEGDPVLFLHADTQLPKGWAEAVGRSLRDPRVVGGAFRFGFDRATIALRLVEWGARLRVALFGLPYGDQGVFARRRVLEEIGGVPQVSLMEDLDLVARLRSRGRLVQIPLVARTSARRHLRGGVLATALRHNLAALAWGLGVERARIARFLGRAS